MKKLLLAYSFLAGCGAATAQSTVTLFGVVDAAFSGASNRSEDRAGPSLLAPTYQNRGAVTVSRTELRNSGYNSSRLGFRGTEDLGGGIAAGFWLEAPVTNDDGANGVATFSRRSTVSLIGPFGEFRLGRDYTASFWNDTVFDPFGSNGVGTSVVFTASSFNLAGGAGGFGGNVNAVRASNMIGYFLPSGLGGFYGQFQYAFHEQVKYDPGSVTPTALNNSRAGRYIAGRVGYASGPLDVAMAYGNSTSGDDFQRGTTDSVKTVNVGASYDFGMAKLMGEASRVTHARDYAVTPIGGGVPDTQIAGYIVGVTVPVGAGLIRASYSRVKYDRNLIASLTPDPSASKIALGYVHNLSKRTALYATVARVTNKNGAALTVSGPAFINNATFTPKTSTGYDFGIRHAF